MEQGAGAEPDRPPEDEPDDGQHRPAESSGEDSPLLQELVAYLRDNRTERREEWARRISEAELLGVMSDEEIFSEATEVYDNYVDALETGSIETLQTYARELSERIIPRGVETHEVLGIVLLLRDVLARSLFTKYQEDLELLNRILDEYEPAANRIAVTVGVSFVEERERVIQRSAGVTSGAIHTGAAAARAAAHPADHRRARLRSCPPTDRAAPGSDSGEPRPGGGHRHHRRRDIDATWPTTSSRRSRRRGSWARARSLPACRRRSPRRSWTSASTSA